MDWSILTSRNAFATPLVLALTSEHGSDVLSYEPETIRECLKQHNRDVSESVVTRVNAAMGLFTSNAFWQDPATFNIVCRALNRSPRPTTAPASIEDMAWGVTEARFLLYDPEDDEFNATNSIGTAVARYVSVVLHAEGVYTPPEALAFAGKVRPSTLVDDPDQMLSLQQRADDEAGQINLTVNTQLRELLSQIIDARIPLQAEAQAQITSTISQLG